MSYALNPPLQPRNGSVLKILTIERISTDHQDERSLDDQRAKSKNFVNDHYGGETEWRSISSRGSGEVIDRESYRDMEDLIDSGWPDLIVVEDLGRICRRLDALRICELCEDFQTRLIAINDHVDTYQPDWKMSAVFSALHHERHNQDTSDRIKRTFRNRIMEGAILVVLPYGYLRAEGAKNDRDVSKDPAAEVIYERWFQMLDEGASYSEVADWLNAQNVPTGPGCRLSQWTPSMVTRITHNSILKGHRRWNRRVCKRNNRTGKRRSVKASPDQHLTRECPHLAFIEPERYDRILRKLDGKNAKYVRGRQLAKDARQGVPRSKTVWPGQSIYCGVCGRVLYYGAHGNTQHLMCSGAIDYKCWNGVSANGFEASRRICDAVKNLIRDLPEFDDVLLDEVRDQVRVQRSQANCRESELRRRLPRLESELENILQFIRSGVLSDTVAAELSRLETEKAEIRDELRDIKASMAHPIELPSARVIRARGLDLFSRCAPESQEFGRLMNQFIEDLVVHPVQLIDGGTARLRASFNVNLMVLLDGEPSSSHLAIEAIKVGQTVDLFEPPQRVQYMSEVVRLSQLRSNGRPAPTERRIADRLGITQPAVQYAKKLYRDMQELGVDDPYQILTSPPPTGKLRRHLHERYRFEPISGAS